MDKNPAQIVQKELVKIEHLKNLIADENGIDEKLLLDTIEGQTNLHEYLLMLEDEIADREATIDAIDIRIKQLQHRKLRMSKASETLRSIILAAMDKAGIKTIEGDLATLTVKTKPRNAVITDEFKIPAEFFDPQDPKLNKSRLLSALKEGSVSGAELDNGGISLQIRRA